MKHKKDEFTFQTVLAESLNKIKKQDTRRRHEMESIEYAFALFFKFTTRLKQKKTTNN